MADIITSTPIHSTIQTQKFIRFKHR